ncbi:PAS domain S-box protein [bacterium]|nr:PAS domain S-box protein [bacterium]
MTQQTKKELQNEIRKLKKQIAQREETDHSDKQFSPMLMQETLAEYAMYLLEIGGQRNIYQIVAEKLRSVAGNKSIVVVNSIEEKQRKLTTEGITGAARSISKIKDFLEKSPKDIIYDADDERLNYLKDGKLHDYGTDLYNIFLGAVPMVVCRAITSFMKLKTIYTIGLTRNNILFGTIVIFSLEKKLLINKEMIETVVKVSSLAIMRQRAKAKMHLEKNKAQIYLETAKVLMLALDKRGNITLINQRGCDILGYKKKEMIGKNWFDNFLPDDIRKQVKWVFGKLLKGEIKEVEYYENPILTKSGETRLIAWHNSYIKNEKGIIDTVLSSGEDITERKRIENELKTLSSIVEQSTEGMALADLNGDLIFVNKAWCKMHGYKNSKTLIGKNLAIFHNREQIKNDVIPFNEKVRKYGTYRGEVGHITRHGKSFPSLMTTTLLKDEHGNPFALAGIAKDISEHKTAEDKLKENEEKLTQIVQGSLTPTFIINDQHIITHWNKACEILTGVSADKMIGTKKQWSAFYTKRRPVLADLIVDNVTEHTIAKVYKDAYAVSVFNNRAYEIEYFFPNLGKNGKWIFFTAVPVKDSKGRIIGAIETLQDITERRKAEESMQKSEEKFRLLAENSIDCIWVLDTNLRFTYLSPSLEKMLGFKPEQWIGTKLSSHFRKKEFLKVGALAAKSLANYKTFTSTIFETKMLNSNKEEVDIEISGRILLDSRGKLIGLQGTTKDITKRRSAEKAMVESEKHLQTLINAIPDFVCFKDGNGRWLKVNDAGARIFQLEELDYHGKSDSELAELNSNLRNTFLTCKKSDAMTWNKGCQFFGEEKISQPDGAVRAYNVTKVPVFHPDGERKGIVIIGHDITERRNMEKAKEAAFQQIKAGEQQQKALNQQLKASEQQLKASELSLLKTNKALSEKSLILEEKIKKANFLYHISLLSGQHPLIIDEYLHNLVEIIPGVMRHPKNSFVRITVSDKEYIGKSFTMTSWKISSKIKVNDSIVGFIEVTCNKNKTAPAKAGFTVEDKKLLPIIADYIGNVLTREYAKEEIQSHEEKYKLLFDNNPISLQSLNRKGYLIQVNDTWLKITGYRREDIIGTWFGDLLTDNYKTVFQNTFSKFLEAGEISGVEFDIIKNDGMIIQVRFEGKCLYDKAGNLTRTLCAFLDISEEKKMKEEEHKIARLESLSVLSAGIAHDFNNYLAGILANLSILKMEIPSGSNLNRSLAEMEKVTFGAKSLTEQLLDFSKGGKPQKEDLDLTELLKSSIRFTLSGSNINFVHDIADNLWGISGDMGQLSRLFGNLLINSQQAMPSGGKITIKASNIKMRKKEIGNLKSGNYVLITISDTGLGIPEENIPNIFDPFFTTKQSGSGLGLSSAYRIVKRHLGHIMISSILGKSTTVNIYLPALGKKVKSSGASLEQLGFIGKGKILFMDDQKYLRDSTSKILDKFGFEVVAVKNEAEAIKEYEAAYNSNSPFTAIILDLTIPGGEGGLRTMQEILKIDPAVKAIVSSGYSNQTVMSDPKKFGFSGAVAKPFMMNELMKTLRKVIGGSSDK